MAQLRIATCPEHAALFPEEQGLIPELALHGITAVSMPWQDIEPGDPVLIRTTWDYTAHLPQFLSWLGRLQDTDTEVINPIPLLLWNMDKRYLIDMQAQGIPIVPTLCMEYDPDTIWALAKRKNWSAAIAKPIRGCGAEGLVKITARGAQEFDVSGNNWAPDAPTRPAGMCLVQPYMPEIQEGEWSLFFFAGAFSHAVRKFPGHDDIRVQEEHGGRSIEAVPSDAVLAAAQAIVAAIPDAFIARVDGIEVAEQFRLMELELIEPELYFRYCPGSLDRFAAAVAAKLGPVLQGPEGKGLHT